MQKTVRRSACLLFILTLTAAIVFPTVAEPLAQVVGNGESAEVDAELPEPLSTQTDAVGEPHGEDLVNIVVEVDAPSLIEYASEKNITVQEAMLRPEGVRTLEKIASLSESTKKALSPYLVETGYTYNAVLSGFSATIRYKDLSRIEGDVRVTNVLLADTYEVPKAVTENEVRVDASTGIFDSTDVGYDGTGTVVAVVDTGTDYTHEVFDMELDDATAAVSKDDVAAIASALSATSLSAAAGDAINEDDLYLTSKLPFAYDYADHDTNVYPSEGHGTHVAGIIAGQSDRIRGVAPKAQIATFKVFSDYGTGATDDVLFAALDDAVKLGVDAINMSLGTSCGFSRESDSESRNDVYDRIEEAGVCLVVAASNDYSSAYGSANGNTNLASNPDSGTIGSPASYPAALSVASISGVKTSYFLLEDGKEIYFKETRTTGQADDNDFTDEILAGKDEAQFEYVVVPGVGYEVNYSSIDVAGKIAVVRRGGNSFEQKIAIAKAKGARGVIIYNNVSGTLSVSVGTQKTIPSCLISMDYGSILAERGSGTLTVSREQLAGPFMSDFSSWGVLPDLTLAPDITAHGGEITSSFPGGDEYDTISGTSMACPNLVGALILVRQYVKELDPTLTAAEVRDLSYSLIMSTATIANNEYGNPYSPRKQGAGLADIVKSITTKAYLTVDAPSSPNPAVPKDDANDLRGQASNKPKLSLGDDPNRTGEYVLEFNITNMSAQSLNYVLDPVVFTESMSSDGRTVAELSSLLDAAYTYDATATEGSAEIAGASLSLGGYSTAKVQVRLQLTESSKRYLDENFKNGMYVEGYVRLNSMNADGIGLNLPFLAFYGDWAAAPMLDVTEYEVGASFEDTSVLDEDKLQPDVYATLPMAGFNSQDENGEQTLSSWGMGAYSYVLPQGYSMPPTVERYASLTSSGSEYGNYMIHSIAAGLLRGAKRIDMQVTDSVTGEVIWTKTGYNGRKSYSSGGEQSGGYVLVEFDVRELGLANNSVYTFSMECYLDWDEGKGNKNTFSFDFTIDNEAPVVQDTYVRDDDGDKTLQFNVYDNHYLQGFAVYTYDHLDANGSPVGLVELSDGVIPAYYFDPELNDVTSLELDVSAYWSVIQEHGGNIYLQVMDYAKNTTTYAVNVNDCQIEGTDMQLEKTRTARDEYTIDQGSRLDLAQYITVKSDIGGNFVENYWSKPLVWESSDTSVATVADFRTEGAQEKDYGVVTGLKTGTTTITVYPQGNERAKLTFTVNVSARTATIGKNDVSVTLSDSSLVLERGESRVVSFTLQPYNLQSLNKELYNEIIAQLTDAWSASGSNIEVCPGYEGADGKWVDDAFCATVTAKESGNASVSVRARPSYASASCSVTVKQEFYVDGIYLRSYTGRGDENGVVEIPDDLGIVYIYPNAFFDNDYITEIIIPEGVQYIMNASIYGCDNLETVWLPSTLEQIQTFGMGWNPKLKTVHGLNNVKIIGSRAFIYDESLELGFNGTSRTQEPNGEYDLASTTFISNMAFYGCTSLRSVDLSKTGIVGEQAFAYCSSLTELVLSENTTADALAFAYCTGLERVEIGSKNVGDAAFAFCTALQSVVFTGDVDTIGVQAFYGCTALSQVTFLKTVYEIADQAFAGCSALASFTIPNGLEILGSQTLYATGVAKLIIAKDARIRETGLAAFYGIPVAEFTVEAGNKYFSSKDGVLYNAAMTKLVAYPVAAGVDEKFTVPATVRTIGANAFAGLTNHGYDASGKEVLSTFSIDLTNVEVIEDYAFFSLGTHYLAYDEAATGQGEIPSEMQLTSNVTLTGGKLRYIGNDAFEQSYITALPDLTNVTYIGDYAFANTPFLSATEVTLPAGLSYLGAGAFTYNGYLAQQDDSGETTYISVEEYTDLASEYYTQKAEYSVMVTAVGEGISSVTFEGDPAVGANAFANCAALTTVGLGSGLRTVAAGMFAYNEQLTQITVPVSVEELGSYAFAGTGLSTITFTNVTDGVWKLERIGDAAFLGCKDLTTITLPVSVTEIGSHAFEGTGLTTFDFDGIETIGDYAFRNVFLTEASSQTVREIGAYAFALFETKEDGTITGLANSAQMTTASFPNAERVGAYAFWYQSKIGTGNGAVNFKNVRSIGEGAFYATGIGAIDFENAEEVGAYAFAGTDAVSADLPKLKTLGAYAFQNSQVSTFELAASVVSVSERAFAEARELEAITVAEGNAWYFAEGGVLYRNTGSNGYVSLVAYPEGKEDSQFTVRDRTIRIGAYAFAGNKHLTTVTLPAHLRIIGAAAFLGCTNLTSVVLNAATAPTLESYAYAPAAGVVSDGDVNIYNNFIAAIGEAQNGALVYSQLKITVPANHTGYDAYIWQQYFGDINGSGSQFVVSEEVAISRSAIDFTDRVGALPLPADITEADRETITVLERIYAALGSAQQAFVKDEYATLLAAKAALPPVQPETPDDGGDETPPEEPAGTNVGLIVGLSVGGAVLLAGIAVGVVLLVRSKKRRG